MDAFQTMEKHRDESFNPAEPKKWEKAGKEGLDGILEGQMDIT